MYRGRPSAAPGRAGPFYTRAVPRGDEPSPARQPGMLPSPLTRPVFPGCLRTDGAVLFPAIIWGGRTSAGREGQTCSEAARFLPPSLLPPPSCPPPCHRGKLLDRFRRSWRWLRGLSKRLHPAPSRQALPLTGRLHSHPPGPPRLAGSPEKQNNKTKQKSLKPARHVLRGISPPQCERPAWPGIRACGVAPGEHGRFPPSRLPGRPKVCSPACHPRESEPGFSSLPTGQYSLR